MHQPPTEPTTDHPVHAHDRVAVEVLAHRRASRLGTVQQHFRLTDPISGVEGLDEVVMIPGTGAVHVFPADPDSGEIAEFPAAATMRGTEDPVDALRILGFRVQSLLIDSGRAS